MFKIEKDKDQIKVHVCLKPRVFARDPYTSVKTSDVLDFLKTKGYNVDTINTKQHAICNTTGANPPLEGTWIFTIKKEEKNVKSVKSTTTKRTTRTQKRSEPQKNKLLRNEDVDGVQPQTQTSVPGQDKKVSGQ